MWLKLTIFENHKTIFYDQTTPTTNLTSYERIINVVLFVNDHRSDQLQSDLSTDGLI